MSLGEQTSAVYRWERECVDPHDRSNLGEGQIKGIVSHVWSTYGLTNPPRVEFNQRSTWSYAKGRTLLTFGSRVNTVMVLHEVCHSMDCSLEVDVGIRDERTREWYGEDGHGPNWLGLYINALDKFMPQPEFRKLFLMYTLQRFGLKPSLAPKLRCL